jgi:hypothetical protein
MTRKSKREIAQKVESMERAESGEYPVVDTVAGLLSYDWECVDASESLYRREGDDRTYRIPPEFIDLLWERFEKE